MDITHLNLGPLETNCYILSSAGIAAVIDPADDGESILNEIQKKSAVLKYIIYTHCHPDHTAASGMVKSNTGAEIIAGKGEDKVIEQFKMLQIQGINCDTAEPERFVSDGDELILGNTSLKIISTPGHSPGGISIYEPGKLFCGDTVFYGSAGRVDLPGGDMRALEMSIKEKIFSLPDDTVIYPGHGPQTTVKQEKNNNPFFSLK
ncbi:MAG: MBL fold metallo-hydrolase [Elusimicrobiota bacterium]